MSERIDLDLVREFCGIAAEHGLLDLDVGYKDFRLKVSRGHGTHMVMQAPPPAAVPAAAAAPAPAAPIRSDLIRVTSPLAGVFYRAPRPGAPPFIEEGTEVTPGQTLCIIEAMKLMNEIAAEGRGRVHRILVQNAEVVDSGQDIILLEPM